MKKRFIATLLAFTMLLSCVCVSSFAVENTKLTVLSVDKLDEKGQTVQKNVAQVSNDDIIAVTFGVRAGTESISACDYQIKINYNGKALETWSQSIDKNEEFYKAVASNKKLVSDASLWLTPTVKDSSIGCITVAGSYAAEPDNGDYTTLNATASAGESIDVVKLAFKVKDQAESGKLLFSFDESYSALNYYCKVDAVTTAPLEFECETAGVDISGKTPELSEVTLNVSNPITVNGTTGATVNATAASAQDTNLTEKVTWSVAPTDNGVSIDATTGTIAVGAKAKAGDYTITATPKNGSSQGEAKSATLTVERATPVYTVTVTPESKEMTVPASGENKESFSATVTNQYDETMTEGVMWSIAPNDDNVSINSSTGEVTVKAEAKNTIEGTTGTEFTVTATYGENTDSATMTVKREESRVSSIELAENAKTTFEVPTVDKTNHEVPEGVEFPTVTVKDQYGEKISAAEVTWTLGSDKPDGVSVDANDKLVISSSVAANDGFADNKLEFTAIASCDGKTQNFKFTLTRQKSTATSVEITSKNTFAVPYSGSRPEDLTCKVYDQYGVEIKSPSEVTWEIEGAAPTGVKIVDGKLVLTNEAAKNSFTEESGKLTCTFKVKATCVGKSAEQTITLTRDAARAMGISDCTWTDGKNEFVVPANNSSVTNSLTVTFVDQYGCEIAAANAPTVTWSASPTTGIEVTGSGSSYTVSVSKDAAQRFSKDDRAKKTVTLTATYDGKAMTQTAELTLKLADAVVTTVQLNGDNSIMIPKTVGSVNTKTYTVTVFDQYGFELPDKAKNATYTFDSSSELVTLDQTNGVATLTVKYGADAVDYKLKATVNGVESEEKTISVTNKSENTTTLKVVQNNVVFGSKIEPTVTGKPQDSTDLVYSYEGVDGTTYASSTVAPTNVGKYKVTVTCETADTFYTKTINFEITAKSIAGMTVTLDHDSLTYNGQNQSVTAELAGLTSSDYTVSGETTGQNAGTYTVTVTGKGNYTGTVAKTWTITPAELTIESVALENRTYNGEKAVTVKSVTFNGLQNSEKLTIDTDYTATGAMTDANAGENKDVTVTVTLKDTVKNYTLKNRVFESGKVTIAKASHEKVAANMEAKYGNTAELDLTTVGLPTGYVLGTPVVDTNPADIFDGSVTLSGSSLSAKLTSDATKAGKTATIKILVSSTNYADYTITVTVTVAAKDTQTITASNIRATYGDTGVKVNATAVGALNYSVISGDDVIDIDASGNVTIKKAGEATIKISAAETNDYAAATKDITVTIAKRPLTVKADDKTAYVGAQQPELTYTVDGLVDGDELTTKPTLKLVHEAEADPMKTAGEYVITFDQAPAADAAKYDLVTADGKLTVSVRPVYVGPTGSPVEVGRSDNGTVTVSPANAAKGTTVTITANPDKGQELKSLEVLDQHGNSLPLTDLGNGKFSFVMPEGKVTIKSEFGKANAYVNPYMDVQTNDWYFGAVQYVTENGLMNGTGKGFEPNLATSRAMIWTILARMSDVNTASGGEWYAVAQQWAIANGVSDGTMPNGTITREQLAAMLYRYAVSKGMVKGPATADLSVFADANSVSSYAVEAMQWAVSTGLIGGMDGKLNPQGSATRAQVATMLMRFAELAK